jgi:hypothetical protein
MSIYDNGCEDNAYVMAMVLDERRINMWRLQDSMLFDANIKEI